MYGLYGYTRKDLIMMVIDVYVYNGELEDFYIEDMTEWDDEILEYEEKIVDEFMNAFGVQLLVESYGGRIADLIDLEELF